VLNNFRDYRQLLDRAGHFAARFQAIPLLQSAFMRASSRQFVLTDVAPQPSLRLEPSDTRLPASNHVVSCRFCSLHVRALIDINRHAVVRKMVDRLR
jgi:hypothetical protein